MNFKDALKKVITPELLAQVEDAVGDDFNWGSDLVPRSRLNKVIEQRDAARKAAETSTSGQAGKTDDDDDPAKGTVSGISEEAHKQALEELQKQKDQELSDLKLQFAVTGKLRDAGVVDPALVWDANLLDKTKLVFDDKGTLGGIEEQLTELKSARSYLFGEGAPSGTGKEGQDPFSSVKSKESFMALPTVEQIKFKAANPAAFKSFLAE